MEVPTSTVEQHHMAQKALKIMMITDKCKIKCIYNFIKNSINSESSSVHN